MSHRRGNGRAAWIVACGVALATGRASAQPAVMPAPSEASQDGDRPWANGVPDEEQVAARDLYAAGNDEFAESRFAQALARYKEAIQHWDHPAIRFNMAVCLINLDRLVEASDSLERSLAYGAVVLGNDAYQQGLTYRKLLDTRLAHVKIHCAEPGSVVTLDGKYLFTGPATAEQSLLPGEHQLAATKPGFRTAVVTFTGTAGKRVTYDLHPSLDIGPAPRWAYWKHVLGGGGGLIAAGVVTYLWGRSDLVDYDRTVDARCPFGCSAEKLHEFAYVRDRFQAKQVAEFTLFAIGGTAAIV
ncbi:MAG TPA: tetratricopeptide repeat protein, partial [Kofleriaceae bacterium]